MLNSKNRIALCLRSLQGGGAERLMVNLAKGFTAKGFDVDLVLNIAEGPYLADVPPDVRIIDLKVKRVVYIIPQLVNYLRSEQPNVILSTLTPQNLIVIVAKQIAQVQTRVVVREANMFSKQIENTKNKRYKYTVKLFSRFLYPKTQAVISLSQGVANDLVETIGISPERVKTIYNPLDISSIQSLAKEPVGHPWFRAHEFPVVIAVGRLIKQKDYPTLIRAFSKARQTYPIRLIILGQGEEESKIIALIKELELENDVSMLGFVRNPFAYMARSDVFVLSSAWEGLGSVLLEALAVGTPIVATDCKSGPAEILENGKYGQLVPVGDITKLADAIIKTLEFSSTGTTLQSRALDFSADKIVDQYLEVLISGR